MELMQIIETTLKVFIVTSTIVILLSYILHKVKTARKLKNKNRMSKMPMNTKLKKSAVENKSVKNDFKNNQFHNEYNDLQEYSQSYQTPAYEEPNNYQNERNDFYAEPQQQQPQAVYNNAQAVYSSRKRFEIVNQEFYANNNRGNNYFGVDFRSGSNRTSYQPVPVRVNEDQNLYKYYSRGNFDEPMHKLKFQSPSRF